MRRLSELSLISLLFLFTPVLSQAQYLITPAMVGPAGSSTDLGSVINAAYTSGQEGTIYLQPASSAGSSVSVTDMNSNCYRYSTPITLQSFISLIGNGSGATCLVYAPDPGHANIAAIEIQGSNSLSKIYLLGDPDIHPHTGLLIHGSGIHVSNVSIGRSRYGQTESSPGVPAYTFALGMTFGDNTYLDSFDSIAIISNDQNMLFPHGLNNSGEELTFTSSSISTDGVSFANCFQNGQITSGSPAGGGEFEFTSTSFDGCQIVNNDGIVKLHGGHFEVGTTAPPKPFLISYSGNWGGLGVGYGVYLDGVTVVTGDQGNVSTPPTGLFEVDNYGTLNINGLADTATKTIPLVYFGANSSAGENPSLRFSDPVNQRTQAQLYATAPAIFPILNISTPAVQMHTSMNSTLFMTGNDDGHNAGVRFNWANLGVYRWSGVDESNGTPHWSGQQLLPDYNGSGFHICGSGFFPFTSYQALGTETQYCGTFLGNNSLVMRPAIATTNPDTNTAQTLVLNGNDGSASFANNAASISGYGNILAGGATSPLNPGFSSIDVGNNNSSQSTLNLNVSNNTPYQSNAQIRFYRNSVYQGGMLIPNGSSDVWVTSNGGTLDAIFSNGGIAVQPGGLVFPDSTVQHTAWTGSITSNGVITSGVWNGTPLTSSYLPTNIVYTDTTQTITGQKTFASNLGVGVSNPAYSLDVKDTIAMNNMPVIATTTIASPSDGTYVIAKGSSLRGEYVISWGSSPNRGQTVHLIVNSNSYDQVGTLQVLDDHSYAYPWAPHVMTNFRLALGEGLITPYLLMDISNRNTSETDTHFIVTFIGTGMDTPNFDGTMLNSSLGALPPGGALHQIIGISSVEDKVGIGTTEPTSTLDVRGKIAIQQSTPTASNDLCVAGQIWTDANYMYVCTAPYAIKRVALSSF